RLYPQGNSGSGVATTLVPTQPARGSRRCCRTAAGSRNRLGFLWLVVKRLVANAIIRRSVASVLSLPLRHVFAVLLCCHTTACLDSDTHQNWCSPRPLPPDSLHARLLCCAQLRLAPAGPH